MNSRNESSGKVKRNKTYAYRYRFALDRGKAVSSITLPRETQTVAVLGIDLIP